MAMLGDSPDEPIQVVQALKTRPKCSATTRLQRLPSVQRPCKCRIQTQSAPGKSKREVNAIDSIRTERRDAACVDDDISST